MYPVYTPRKWSKDTLCTDCLSRPLSRASFRDLVGGATVVHTIKASQLKYSASRCGFCHLLWQAGRSTFVNEPLPDEIRFELRIQQERSDKIFRSISPAGVQYLYVKPGHVTGRIYYLYTSPDDPAASEIVARTPILNVGSPRAYSLALKALEECISNHSNCPQPSYDTPLPTRVIDCEDSRHPVLLETTKSQTTMSPTPYIALSYVWGGPQPNRTLTTNLKEYITKGIHPSLIPQTIQDAMEVTRRLGCRYLWVDALCIIQNSEEDKLKELIKMKGIYRNAYITIIASSSDSSDTGFLHERGLSKEYREHPHIPFHCRSGTVGSMYVYSPEGPASAYEPMREPVNSRAWCLQERLLSPRKLVYATDTIQYHCQTALADVGNAVSGKPVGEQLDDIMFFKSTPSQLSIRTLKSLHETWRMVVANYTRRRLSFDEDKLLAFAGVAEEFHLIWGTDAGRYFAGIWENLLPHDFLWMRMSGLSGDTGISRLSGSFAPSWSWASVNGSVFPDDTEWDGRSGRGQSETCRVIRSDFTVTDERLPYGHVLHALVELECVMVPTPWIVFPEGEGSNPEVYLSLYLPTTKLQRICQERITPTTTFSTHSNSECRGSIHVGDIVEYSDDGNEISRKKEFLTLGKDPPPTSASGNENEKLKPNLNGNPNTLLAFNSDLEPDYSLLSFMGDISIFFDTSEHVPLSTVHAIVIKSNFVSTVVGYGAEGSGARVGDGSPLEPTAKGILVADTGNGRFKRLAYWLSLVQKRGNGDEGGNVPLRRKPWFDSEELGAKFCTIELI